MKMVVVTDSNGRGLDLNLLKPTPEVKIERVYRFTLPEAIETIPEIENPDSISDVVFQVGLNDSRRGLSADRIRNDTLEMQMRYKQKFKNARQHIVALPPLSDSQIETNKSLQKLANHTNCNFITTKAFRDRTTGQMRQNLVDEYHYNAVGIKTLAREIKKSLFSPSNLNSTSLNTLIEMQESVKTLNRSLNEV